MTSQKDWITKLTSFGLQEIKNECGEPIIYIFLRSDSEIKNSNTSVWWKCNNGHEVKLPLSKLKMGILCKFCKSNKKGPQINDYINLAKKYNGEWLGIKKDNSFVQIKPRYVKDLSYWKCNNGVVFEKSYDTIKYGHWCQCKSCNTHNAILDENDYIQLAKEKTLEYIGPFPKNSKTKCGWKCSFGHSFQDTYDCVRGSINSSCWECAHSKLIQDKRLTFEDYLHLGELIGNDFIECQNIPEKNTIPVMWMCKIHGVFKLCYNKLQERGKVGNTGGCQKCRMDKRNNDQRLELKDYIKLGKEKGYPYVLEQELPLRNYEKCKWKCDMKTLNCVHGIFEMSYSNLSRGEGCYRCSEYKTENICRTLIEINIQKLIDYKLIKTNEINYRFPRTKKEWLKNKKGNLLELDGLCEELKLAFEYNGIQHYEFHPFFHRVIEDFYEDQEHDKIKKEKLNEHNIVLFTIPYRYDFRNVKLIDCYIWNFLIDFFKLKMIFS